jgi:hypothetical protein
MVLGDFIILLFVFKELFQDIVLRETELPGFQMVQIFRFLILIPITHNGCISPRQEHQCGFFNVRVLRIVDQR